MKGLELPINLIIIIIIAGVILLALLYLFTNAWQSGGGGVQSENVFRSLCQKFVTQYNCDPNKISQVSLTISGKTYSLSTECSSRGVSGDACARACGCLI
ncbi:MAG: hypothetical protein QXY29_01080 [Candidatus Aenigmatarchaeota archaeon]